MVSAWRGAFGLCINAVLRLALFLRALTISFRLEPAGAVTIVLPAALRWLTPAALPCFYARALYC